ncbi:hypothetical protein CTAYLR_009191 [Chrysophaeum taylorii]|uniref:cGMP-dependent protein kinase n=1 Tax=Chrysophaeum taylorii TaxID=2483200 RepID=A0AAD7XQQ7_9STRA|nr:hypothetical protein CTAYLR_009191 [Chrysophaeum taylorii]
MGAGASHGAEEEPPPPSTPPPPSSSSSSFPRRLSGIMEPQCRRFGSTPPRKLRWSGKLSAAEFSKMKQVLSMRLLEGSKVEDERSPEKLKRGSTGSIEQPSGRPRRSVVYSTGLTEAVLGRLRLKEKLRRLPSTSSSSPSEAELRDSNRTLAAAEVFNLVTIYFKQPTISDAAREHVIRRLRKSRESVGTQLIEQGTAGHALFVLVDGRIAASRNGAKRKELTPPCLFGEVSVIYGTSTATYTVTSEEATLFKLAKADWAFFVTMDLPCLRDDGALLLLLPPRGGSVNDEEEKSSSSLYVSDHHHNHAPPEKVTFTLSEIEPVAKLGEGGFSTVTLARAGGTYYAMKTIEKESIERHKLGKKIVVEKQVLERVASSAFCLRLHATFADADCLYLLTEVAECGDLMDHMIKLDTIPEADARFYAACICCGISHCHRAGLVHRDVKPENCFVYADGRLKLGDFGLARILPYTVQLDQGRHKKCTLAFTMCGTPEFLAPEFIFSRGYDARVDWWAFGCIVYEMLFGENPFADDDLNSTFNKICSAASGYYPATAEANFTGTNHSTAAFLRGLMSGRDDRLDDPAIKRHAYFDGFDWARFHAGAMLPPPTGPNKVLNCEPDDDPAFLDSYPTPYTGDESLFDGFAL